MDLRSHHTGEGLTSPNDCANTAAAEAPEAPAQAVVEWRVHLARRRPAAIAPLLLALAAALALAYAVFGHAVPVLVTGVVLFSAVSEFLLPISFRLTPQGVTRRNGLGYTVLEWRRVRRACADGDGVKLSPLGTASRLEAFRGIYLRLPEDAFLRARVMDALRAYCPAAGAIGAEQTDAGG